MKDALPRRYANAAESLDSGFAGMMRAEMIRFLRSSQRRAADASAVGLAATFPPGSSPAQDITMTITDADPPTCCICCKEVPPSAVFSPEAAPYVMQFLWPG